MIHYGGAPIDLGPVDISPTEMMIYLYLPIKMKNSEIRLPANLSAIQGLQEMIDLASIDASRTLDINDHYIYLTFKTMFVSGEFSGNRPGWHADGYGSGGDLNYIWYDMNPTQFAVQDFHDIPDDDFASMAAMEEQIDEDAIMVYPNCHLLRLDESIVHRVNPNIQSGMRTFGKISISRNQFNLRMNSHNHLFDYDWTMYDRAEVRNMDNKDYIIGS